MSLQGHEKAAAILAQAFMDRADDAVARAQQAVENKNADLALQYSSAGMIMSYIGSAYDLAADRMEVEIRQATTLEARGNLDG